MVAQVSYDIDYIIELVNQYRAAAGQPGQRQRRENIIRAIRMNETLRSKKDLIEEFLNRVDSHDPNLPAWPVYVRYRLQRDVAELIDAEKLKDKLARAFIQKMFKRGYVLSAGTELSEILPPISRFRGTSTPRRASGSSSGSSGCWSATSISSSRRSSAGSEFKAIK